MKTYSKAKGSWKMNPGTFLGVIFLLMVGVALAEDEERGVPTTGNQQEQQQNELVCLNPERGDRSSPPAQQKQHALTQWHDYWRRIFLQWLPAQSSFNQEAESALSTSHNRVATTHPCAPAEDDDADNRRGRDHRNCKILQVFDHRQCSVDVAYELFEPLELELGDRKAKHAVDYAYSPVVIQETNNFSVEPVVTDSTPHHWIQDSFLSGGWWWNFLSSWRNRNGAIQSYRSRYQMNKEAFAGGSHGEIWRGRRKCFDNNNMNDCNSREPLIFKRLKVESGGYRVLEAGLREVYFGNLLRGLLSDDDSERPRFTSYVEHFFAENGELWIVFKDAGSSLRSFLYSGSNAGDYVVYQHSWLWTLIRMSLAENEYNSGEGITAVDVLDTQEQGNGKNATSSSLVGRQLMKTFLRQILEAAAFLGENSIVHRDIKPSNIMCNSNIDLKSLQSLEGTAIQVNCVLGDFSSAYNLFTSRNLYTGRPSKLEQTDEYAPPEAIFGYLYNNSAIELTSSFDSWSIGIVALELLLGTPNVFSVDQRTRMVLSHKMRKKGAAEEEIERAMYLAALSQFCIYNPSNQNKPDWPLRDGDPLHKSAMTKHSCTLNDFHRALRARDPLGWGFENTDLLLHLIWQLLAWDPKVRMTASEALRHPYFTTMDVVYAADAFPGEHTALESQMLDPRMDFNLSDSIDEFVCPKCGRVFGDWKSCHSHANSRRHAKFCTYDHSLLPTCLHAHSMLPAHSYSGYCDMQGRRSTIEDFHAIHLLPFRQFYGIFDGHLGNFASKFAASFLYSELSTRLDGRINTNDENWKHNVEVYANEAFTAVHVNFLSAIARAPHGFMDQSGTTATALLVTDGAYVIVSLGDSRAVLSSKSIVEGKFQLTAVQLTKDHVASDAEERKMVERRGGSVFGRGIDRVNGTLAITRSIGDAALSPYLSRQPQVISMTRAEIMDACGGDVGDPDNEIAYPCFLVLASDGLWDTIDNQEAVDLVAQVVSEQSVGNSWRESPSMQRAAEALTHEAYVRGSTDNIGVCIVAIEA